MFPTIPLLFVALALRPKMGELEQVTEVDLRRLEKYKVALEYLTTCE